MLYAVRSAITATAELLVIYTSLTQIWTGQWKDARLMDRNLYDPVDRYPAVASRVATTSHNVVSVYSLVYTAAAAVCACLPAY